MPVNTETSAAPPTAEAPLLPAAIIVVHDAPVPVHPYASATSAATAEEVWSSQMRRSRPLLAIRVDHEVLPRAATTEKPTAVNANSRVTSASATASSHALTPLPSSTSAQSRGGTQWNAAAPEQLVLTDRKRDVPVAEIRSRRDPAYELQKREQSVGVQTASSALSGYVNTGSQAGPLGLPASKAIQVDSDVDSTLHPDARIVPGTHIPALLLSSNLPSNFDSVEGAAASSGAVSSILPGAMMQEIASVEASAAALLSESGGGSGSVGGLRALLHRAMALAAALETGLSLPDATTAIAIADRGSAAAPGSRTRGGGRRDSTSSPSVAAGAAAAGPGAALKTPALITTTTSTTRRGGAEGGSEVPPPMALSSMAAAVYAAAAADKTSPSVPHTRGLGGGTGMITATNALMSSAPVYKLLAFLSAALPTAEVALSQNETLDIYSSTESFLGPPRDDDEDDGAESSHNSSSGGGASGTSGDSALGFREERQLMDLVLTNNKSLSVVEWHPRASTWLAASALANLTLEQRLSESDVPKPGHLLMLTTTEFSAPLVLDTPSEIVAMHWNPNVPQLIAVGLASGQVALFELTDGMRQQVAQRTKGQNKLAGLLPQAEGGQTAPAGVAVAVAAVVSNVGSDATPATASASNAASTATPPSSHDPSGDVNQATAAQTTRSSATSLLPPSVGNARHVQPKYVSSVDTSHSRTVIGLKWLPPTHHLNSRMAFTEERSGGETAGRLVLSSHQFLSVGAEGSVCVWDIRFPERAVRTKRSGALATAHEPRGASAAAAATDAGTAAAPVTPPWAPHYHAQLRLDGLAGGSSSSAGTTIAEGRTVDGSAATAGGGATASSSGSSSSGSGSSPGRTITCFAISPWNVAEPLICGTDDGRVVAVDWTPPGEAVGIEPWVLLKSSSSSGGGGGGGSSGARPLTGAAAASTTSRSSHAATAAAAESSSSGRPHGGSSALFDSSIGASRIVWASSQLPTSRPVIAVLRSPHHPSIFAVVLDFQVSIWQRGCGCGALLMLPPSSPAITLTAARWSPTRPAVLVVGRSDGVLEAWDLLDSTSQPALTLPLVSCAVASIEFRGGSSSTPPTAAGTHLAPGTRGGTGSNNSSSSSGGGGKQLLAVGDAKGTLHILEVPSSLSKSGGGTAFEDTRLEAYFNLEAERSVYMSHRAKVHEAERIAAEAAAREAVDVAAASAGAKGDAGSATAGGAKQPPPVTAASQLNAATSTSHASVGLSEAEYAVLEREVMAKFGLTASDIAVCN